MASSGSRKDSFGKRGSDKDGDSGSNHLGSPPMNFNFWAPKQKVESSGLKKIKLEEKFEETTGIQGLSQAKKYPLDLLVTGRRRITFTKDPKKYFWKFTAMDEQGTEISIIVFETQIFEVCEECFKMDEVVHLSNYSLETVRQDNMKYEPYKMQLRLHANSKINKSSEEIMTPFRSFSKVEDIRKMNLEQCVDCLGIVVYVSDMEEYENSSRRSLVLSDAWDQNIELHLWNQEGLAFTGNVGDSCAVLKGFTKEYRGVVILTATSKSTIWVNPSEEKVTEVIALKKWFAEAVEELNKKEAETKIKDTGNENEDRQIVMSDTPTLTEGAEK